MSTRRTSPTLRRRRLSQELRALRERAGLTSSEASKRLGWSGGRLNKMERGEWARPNPQNIDDLCDLYEATGRERAYLLNLTRQAREQGWWHAYREMLSEDYTTLIGLEVEASSVRAWEPLVFHGLLQTEDYARAVIADGPAEIGPDDVDKRTAIRLERQKLLTGPDPLRLWMIVDEAALRRVVGGPDVMREQLHHIVATAHDVSTVTVQVVSFATGVHAGVTGSFAVMEFPEPEDQDAAFTENPAGQFMTEMPADVGRFSVAFQRLQAVALPPSDSVALISSIAEE